MSLDRVREAGTRMRWPWAVLLLRAAQHRQGSQQVPGREQAPLQQAPAQDLSWGSGSRVPIHRQPWVTVSLPSRCRCPVPSEHRSLLCLAATGAARPATPALPKPLRRAHSACRQFGTPATQVCWTPQRGPSSGLRWAWISLCTHTMAGEPTSTTRCSEVSRLLTRGTATDTTQAVAGGNAGSQHPPHLQLAPRRAVAAADHPPTAAAATVRRPRHRHRRIQLPLMTATAARTAPAPAANSPSHQTATSETPTWCTWASRRHECGAARPHLPRRRRPHHHLRRQEPGGDGQVQRKGQAQQRMALQGGLPGPLRERHFHRCLTHLLPPHPPPHHRLRHLPHHRRHRHPMTA